MCGMNLKSILETILFVHGEPISEEKLAKLANVKKGEITLALAELSKDYEGRAAAGEPRPEGRGLALLKKDDEWCLGTNPENAKFVKDLMKGEFSEELSRAAIETAAIIAYQGPITRAEIEYVRGVNSSFILRNLLMRGLVERIENPKDARSYLYRISFDFLKHLGLTKIGDLPQYQEFRQEKMGGLEILQESKNEEHAK